MAQHTMTARVALLVAALFVLAACGGSTEPTGQGPGAEKAASAGTGHPAPGGDDAYAPFRAPEPEKVVARVNGAPLLAKDVWEVAGTMIQTAQASGRTLPEGGELDARRYALDNLISDELLYQAAREAKVEVSPEELDQEAERRKAALGSPEAFQEFLRNSGRTEEELRQKVERQLVIDRFVKDQLSRLKVPDEMAKKFYDENSELFRVGEQSRVSFILINSRTDDPAAKRDDARKRIDEAHDRAVAGEDFGQLARDYSQAPNAAKGGDTGFFPRGAMFPKFEEMAFTLPTGSVSPVFETPVGFNILKVTDRKEAHVPEFEEVRSSISLQLLRVAEREALLGLLQSLRESSSVEILDPTLEMPDEGAAESEAPGTESAPSGS